MMSYAVPSREKAKTFGQVFTPAGTVFDMVLLKEFIPLLKDVDKTFLDPAVGEGQFPCATLVWKLFFNIERLDEDLALRALKSLYGIDIQPSSVDITREHLILTLCDAYKFFTGGNFSRLDEARAIVEKNIFYGDSLEIMKQWTEPQLSLF